MALPIVAIVGRPNVGKSTLVNRIAQTGDAIVHEMRGVTRDRSYHKADWNGVEFMLIDTGGIEMGGDDAFQGSIRAQAFEGAREADVIIFLVDGKAGINTDDEEVARILQKAGKPVFVAVNKMDNPARMDEVWEFYALGLGDPWPVSAQHGNGTGDLLDEVVNELRKVEIVPEEEVEAINVAIIGRPNAGKSSLTNKLTNNNRSIVSDVAGIVVALLIAAGRRAAGIGFAAVFAAAALLEQMNERGLLDALGSTSAAAVTLRFLSALVLQLMPFAVVFRFFPTVLEEYRSIRDAMRLRGVGWRSGPVALVEYRLVPLVAGMVKIGDELSAASVTRGLGGEAVRTSRCRIGFAAADAALATVFLACAAATAAKGLMGW